MQTISVQESLIFLLSSRNNTNLKLKNHKINGPLFFPTISLPLYTIDLTRFYKVITYKILPHICNMIFDYFRHAYITFILENVDNFS
jgi:hypothetical protein